MVTEATAEGDGYGGQVPQAIRGALHTTVDARTAHGLWGLVGRPGSIVAGLFGEPRRIAAERRGERSCSEHPAGLTPTSLSNYPPEKPHHLREAILSPQGSFAIQTLVQTAKSNEPPQGGLSQSPNPSEVNLRESVCPGGRCYPPGPGPPCISRELRLRSPRTGCESLQGGPYKGLSHSDRGPLRALSPRSYEEGRGQSLVCPSPQPPNP